MMMIKMHFLKKSQVFFYHSFSLFFVSFSTIASNVGPIFIPGLVENSTNLQSKKALIDLEPFHFDGVRKMSCRLLFYGNITIFLSFKKKFPKFFILREDRTGQRFLRQPILVKQEETFLKIKLEILSISQNNHFWQSKTTTTRNCLVLLILATHPLCNSYYKTILLFVYSLLHKNYLYMVPWGYIVHLRHNHLVHH